MKVTITVEVAPFAGAAADNNVQLDQARNLIEAAATAVSSREPGGEIKTKFGTATFKVTPDAQPK